MRSIHSTSRVTCWRRASASENGATLIMGPGCWGALTGQLTACRCLWMRLYRLHLVPTTRALCYAQVALVSLRRSLARHYHVCRTPCWATNCVGWLLIGCDDGT